LVFWKLVPSDAIRSAGMMYLIASMMTPIDGCTWRVKGEKRQKLLILGVYSYWVVSTLPLQRMKPSGIYFILSLPQRRIIEELNGIFVKIEATNS
jgi:hypothetical protein